jgi:hypothetical protein
MKDKTFGLKNKKGAKQQKFIQQVVKQVDNKIIGGKPVSQLNFLIILIWSNLF